MSVSFDKFSGCLIGQCLGDALGYPVEGFPSDECLDYLHRQMVPLRHDAHAQTAYPFGQYTDDSQMARELLASLVVHPQFSADDYIARLRPLFEGGLAIVPGLACVDAMRRIAAGVPWQYAGCPPPQAGNGTAMRAAPVGMIFHNEPEQMIRVARQQGWITHRDPRCDAGSIAVAGAVALSLKGEIEASQFCEQLAEWMSEGDREFAGYVCKLPAYLPLRPEEAVDWIAQVGKPAGYVDFWPGISPFVVGTVLWSLYCFLRTPDDYYASVWTAIAVGGDVDTTAAITGAISGAYNGRSSLPSHLLEMLHDHGSWRIFDLEALCLRAHSKG
jgi:ADP-ribosylglycohydrolase